MGAAGVGVGLAVGLPAGVGFSVVVAVGLTVGDGDGELVDVGASLGSTTSNVGSGWLGIAVGQPPAPVG